MKIRYRNSRLFDLEQRAQSLLKRAMEARNKPACEHFGCKVDKFDRLGYAAGSPLYTYDDFG